MKNKILSLANIKISQKLSILEVKNKMRNLKIDKLVINICVGESGDRLTRAAKVVEQLTEQDYILK